MMEFCSIDGIQVRRIGRARQQIAG